MELFRDSLDFFVGWRLGQFFAWPKRVVGDTWSGTGNRLVDRLFIGPGADLFPIFRHRAPPRPLFIAISAQPAGNVPLALLRPTGEPPIYLSMTRSLPIL